MRSWILVLLTLTAPSLSALEVERMEKLCSKVILQNTNGYFVFSDGSCWKAIGFSKRWRSFSEWWNNVQLAPESYDCVPNDWYLGAEIEIHPKIDALQVSESDASNQQIIQQCTHLLVHSTTNKVLFAIALQPAECIVQLFNDSYRDGYDKGRLDGYNAGHSDGMRARVN